MQTETKKYTHPRGLEAPEESLMKTNFTEMFHLQKKLNDETNGECWKSGFTKNGKPIDWHKCIMAEAFECWDSYPWKHWKDIDGVVDQDNVLVEIVDLWHFFMSDSLREHTVKEAIELVLSEHTALFESNTREELIKNDTPALLEQLIRSALDKKTDFQLFFSIVYSIENFNMDELFKLYLGKNCLNKFRQNNGYKQGTYLKMWGEEEDNVFMKKIVDTTPNISFVELYRLLSHEYKIYTKGETF